MLKVPGSVPVMTHNRSNHRSCLSTLLDMKSIAPVLQRMKGDSLTVLAEVSSFRTGRSQFYCCGRCEMEMIARLEHAVTNDLFLPEQVLPAVSDYVSLVAAEKQFLAGLKASFWNRTQDVFGGLVLYLCHSIKLHGATSPSHCVGRDQSQRPHLGLQLKSKVVKWGQNLTLLTWPVPNPSILHISSSRALTWRSPCC